MTAHPAQPVLASTLLDVAREKRRNHQNVKCKKASTGCRSIDDVVLDGGFTDTCTGAVVSIAIERANDREINFSHLLFHHILATHLLSTCHSQTGHGASHVFFIDPTGSFSPHLLHRILCRRLQASRNPTGAFAHAGGYVYTPTDPHNPQTAHDDEALKAEAASMLDVVSVMRVFDFEGLMESVGEISDALSQPLQPTHNAASPSPPHRDQVPDSDQDSDAGTPLDWPATPPPPLQPPASQPLILIPSLHALLSPLIRHAPTRGHALLTHLQRRLRSLATLHASLVVLGNTTVSPHAQDAVKPQDRLSVFEDVTMRPALGRTFAQGVDVSVLVTRRRGAASASAREKQGETAVVEVLADRCGGRVGRWAGVVFGVGEGAEDIR